MEDPLPDPPQNDCAPPPRLRFRLLRSAIERMDADVAKEPARPAMIARFEGSNWKSMMVSRVYPDGAHEHVFVSDLISTWRYNAKAMQEWLDLLEEDLDESPVLPWVYLFFAFLSVTIVFLVSQPIASTRALLRHLQGIRDLPMLDAPPAESKEAR